MAYPNGLAALPVPRPTTRAYSQMVDYGVGWPSVMRWASENEWQARAAAYDRYLDAKREKVGMSEIMQMKKARAKAIRDLSHIAELERAKILRQSAQEAADPVSLRDLLALEDLLAKYTRLEAGEPTDRTASTVDLAAWPLESLQTLHDLFRKHTP